MRVLLIGGTGFIGSRVVARLIETGNEVAVFHRGETNENLPGATHINGEHSELPNLANRFAELGPDATVDMICYTKQDANDLVKSTELLFSKPQTVKPRHRLVVASSMDVYRSYGKLLGLQEGEPDEPPFHEDSELRTVEYPHRAIAKSPRDFAMHYEKLHVERTVREAAPNTTILRLPAVYGPDDKYHRTFEYLKRMDDGRKKILLDDARARWRWTRGYVANVADAIALALSDERAAGRTYNVGEGNALSESEWITAIGRAAGWSGEIIELDKQKLPAQLRTSYNYQHQLECDTGRIRKELGYEERISREEAIKRTVDWERENPMAQFDPAAFDYSAEDAAIEALNKM